MPRRYASYDPEFQIFHQLVDRSEHSFSANRYPAFDLAFWSTQPSVDPKPMAGILSEPHRWNGNRVRLLIFTTSFIKPVMNRPLRFQYSQVYDEKLDTYVSIENS